MSRWSKYCEGLGRECSSPHVRLYFKGKDEFKQHQIDNERIRENHSNEIDKRKRNGGWGGY